MPKKSVKHVVLEFDVLFSDGIPEITKVKVYGFKLPKCCRFDASSGGTGWNVIYSDDGTTGVVLEPVKE